MRYDLWIEHEEQWDSRTPKKPTFHTEAASVNDAALKAHELRGYSAWIVRTPDGVYWQVLVDVEPYVKTAKPISLAELRDEPVKRPTPKRSVRP